MMRETNVQRLDWADKTMSLLRQSQLEACEKRLAGLPTFGLFTYDDNLHAEELWALSLDAQEERVQTHLHTTHELRAMVLSRLPMEATLLTADEHRLLERLISLGGEAELMDWPEVSAAETLVRRLWCTLTHDEDRFVLHLPQQLLTPLLLIFSEARHEELHMRLMRHDAIIRAMLYLGGLLHYSEPLAHLMEDVLESRNDAMVQRLAMRYLRAAYDYCYDRNGDMLLLHPGLAEPERLLALTPDYDGHPLELNEETIRGAMEGVLPEEHPATERLYGLLQRSTRPEIGVWEAVEDLRILVKQGVSMQEMQEVLSSLLMVHPTQEMFHALADLHRLTPRWGAMRMNCLQ